jgi:hypothetical protein
MGYYVSRNHINVRLRKEFGDRVLEAVNSLFNENGEPVRSDAGECRYDGGKVVSRNYSWVQGPGSRENFPSLETALKDWWHELEDSEEAGFWEIEPTDHHDKWGTTTSLSAPFCRFARTAPRFSARARMTIIGTTKRQMVMWNTARAGSAGTGPLGDWRWTNDLPS